MPDSPATPLAYLEQHFAAMLPRRVEIEGFPFPLFFRPLTAREAFRLAKATQDPKADQQSRVYAELIAATALDAEENGKQLFPLEKGGPNPVEILTERTPPLIFAGLVSALVEGLTGQEEKLEKK